MNEAQQKAPRSNTRGTRKKRRILSTCSLMLAGTLFLTSCGKSNKTPELQKAENYLDKAELVQKAIEDRDTQSKKTLDLRKKLETAITDSTQKEAAIVAAKVALELAKPAKQEPVTKTDSTSTKKHKKQK